MKVIYMGTPDFAVPALEALIATEHEVVAVVTMPDKPVGRHQSTLAASPVKQCAQRHGIPVLQPVRLKDEAFLEELRSYGADLFVVVAFRMLPEVVWAMPPRGTFNLHAALLPQYRGAAPINWAVINGDKETGVTTFFLDAHMDTGSIIARRSIPIADDDDAGDVHDALMSIGAQLVVETVQQIAAGDVQPVAQEQLTTESLRPAPKIFKETCRIPWTQGAERAYNFIRGLAPYPAAWTMLQTAAGERELKVFATERLSTPRAETPEAVGALLQPSATELLVLLADGALRLKEVQIAGKRRMPMADFLRGQRDELLRVQ